MYSLSSPSHLGLHERMCMRLNIKIKNLKVGRIPQLFTTVGLSYHRAMTGSFISFFFKKGKSKQTLNK